MRVILVGVSTRAAAESAARAGFEVTAIDAFGDLDQQPSVEARRVNGAFSPSAAVRAAQDVEADAVAYLSNFENHPDAVAALAEGRALWGNSPDVLHRVRDPILLRQAIGRHGLSTLEAYVVSDFSRTSGEVRLKPDTTYLVKPLASGGGHRVRPWRHGTRLPRGCYLQEFIEGTPGSIVFVAAGGTAVPLGVSRQLVGEDAFGAPAFRYCGNILAHAGDAGLVDAAWTLAQAVAEEFSLVGVNGIDFVARDRVPWAVEVNPRWCASMELVERAYGIGVFAAHAAACTTATLPTFDLRRTGRGGGAVGKAIVFARRDVTVGDTHAWLPASGDDVDAAIRDVPRPGQTIAASRPVCTVFAEASDSEACRAELHHRAALVYADLARWETT